jgi:two-component system, chemotaxis family, CheB/CheR fusion protein
MAADKEQAGARKNGAAPAAHKKFAIVGIGASAGGLEALTKLFGAMPGDSGMGFVVVQHLDPGRESHMAELLDRASSMPVREVEDGASVEPNHVYVIRPDRELTIDRRVLHLASPRERRGARHPVDMFFRSLADDQEDCAIGIVLSGSGSNGSAGIRTIKEKGGLTIAQDPETAAHTGMPRNSIATGIIDHVMAPEKMPEALLRYARHLEHPATKPPELAEGGEAHMKRLLAFLRARSGHEFRCYKTSTLTRRIHRRMGLSGHARLPDYEDFLRGDPNEVDALVKDLMIGVTGFFRDPEAWEALDRKVIAPLVRERETGDSIRIWVPACATGDEAFSVAILLAARAAEAQKSFEIKIFATDAANHHLEFARRGVFPAAIEKDVLPDRFARFFEADGDGYRVKPELRDWVIFAPQDLLRDPPFFRLDLITCRNLLIYLEDDAQARSLALFHFALNEGGHLFLGNAETTGRHAGLFETVSKKWRIYRRLGPTRHDIVDFPIAGHGGGRRGEEHPIPAASSSEEQAKPPLVALRLLAERYAPACVLIDRAYRILYFHGETEKYLSQPSGEPTRDLLTLAREGLRTRLRSNVQRVIGQNKATSFDAWVKLRDSIRQVATTVEPLRGGGTEHLILVTFKDVEEVAEPARAQAESGADDRTSELEFETELQRVRDELHRTIEQLETSNEELKASNEEITSMNEELQSSNEELETSKEELQSLNEELNTVNSQLQRKIEELEDTTNDVANLLASTDIATVFLDRQFRIRRFTPAMSGLVEVMESDIGRPFRHLAARFTDERLMDDARRVLETLVPIEAEVPGDDEAWYLRRVLPYRTQDDRIDGVVVTFTDVATAKHAEQVLRAAHEHMQSIYDTMHGPMLVLRPDLRVQSANASFYATFKVAPEETEGRLIYELGNHQWDIPRLRELLGDILPANHAFQDFEVEHEFEGRGRRTMLLNARRLDEVQLILLAIEDVTERRHWEERQELLLGELSHRIKNMLATVQGIASQTLRSAPSLEAFYDTFSGRIQAVGSAHRLLTEGSLQSAHLGTLIEEVLQPHRERIDVGGDDLELAPRAAPALSLVINELATNAQKYGALSSPSGRVDVRWEVQGNPRKRSVHLSWRERGGPPAQPPEVKGFGMNLIERSIAYELDGKVEVDFGEEGLSCRMVIPLVPENFRLPPA